VADFYYGDYYPLTPYRTGSTEWMAWQFNRPEQGDGMVQAFRRPASSFECSRFRLRGLDAAARYGLVDFDTSGDTVMSGRELMEQGLPVSIKGHPGAVIIVYRKTLH
jgi:alpha-galactosidase